MAVHVPSYLYLSRHHVWYFRWPLPASLHPQNQVRHVRLSLGTRDPKEALRLAKRLEYHAVSINRKLIASSMSYADVQKGLRAFFTQLLEQEKRELELNGGLSEEQVRQLQHGVSAIQTHLLEGDNEPAINTDIDDELADNIIEYVKHDIPHLDIPKGTPAYERFKRDMKLPYLSYCKELLLYNSGLNDYDLGTPQTINLTVQPQKSGITLAKAVEDFVAERVRGGAWGFRTKERRETQLSLLRSLCGDDCDLASFDAVKVAKVKKALQEIPKNRNTNPKTRDLPLEEAMKVEGIEKLDTKTINDYLATYHSLFAWAESQGFIEKNVFGKLNIRQKKTSDNKRKAFTKEQIKTILAALPQYTPEKCGKSYPYWGTLIGIYTGARVNEIAQLEIADIKQENGIWYFDLNDEGNTKQLKNKTSKRRVPIHDALLSLGLLERIEHLKKQKQTRLFPDTRYKEGAGYGHYLSRWMNSDFLVSIGMKTKGLSFHGFRHSVVTNLLNLGVGQGIVQDIVGHSKMGVTEGVYNSGYSLEVLKNAVNKLAYE